MKCKYCGEKSLNGTNFCSRAHRLAWIKDHNVKGAKKKAEKEYELALMSYGSSFSNEY